MGSPLRERMLAAGAIFDSPGAGAPRSFGDPGRESAAALSGCVVADRGSLGRIRVGGRDRRDLLHRLSTNEINALRSGEGNLTVLLNARGRIVDLLHALALESDLLLITSVGTGEKVRSWLEGYVFREDVTLEDAGALPCLALHGPDSPAILRRLAGGEWSGLPPAHHREARIAQAAVRCAGTFPLAGSGFLLLGEPGGSLPLWDALVEAGAVPAGSDALERLRIAAGVPSHGKELTEERNPYEAGLDAAVSLSKGCYLGQEVVARLHNYRKIQRRLACLGLQRAEVPEGSRVFHGAEEIGVVTSSAPSLSGEGTAALGILGAGHVQPGTEVTVAVPDGRVSGLILPFPNPGGGR